MHPEIAIFFFVIAFIYSSVGFGGGSSYLAVLALYRLPFQEVRLIALLCNIVVVTGGIIIFIRKKQVNFKKMLPLVFASVPLAFAGAACRVSQQFFFVLLGISLIVSAVLLWLNSSLRKNSTSAAGTPSAVKDAMLGGSIGFLSGMVGIGGGIFLSPLLNLMRWDTAKKIAATASIFILLNSISGIAGYLYLIPEKINWWQAGILATSVFVGGQLGSRLGAVRLDELLIKRVTAILVLAAGIEVLYRHLA